MAGRPVHTFEVVRTEQLTPHLTRVVLGGSGFDTFTPNDFTDAYVKIVFVQNGTDVGALPQPLTLDSFKSLSPAWGHLPLAGDSRPSAPIPSGKSTPSAARSRSTSSCTEITVSRARGWPRRPPANRHI